MSIWVTPSLLVGSEYCTTNIVTTPCVTAHDAVAVIAAGGHAWLPRDDWDELVREILRDLGVDDPWIERQIHYARTGVLLTREDFAQA